MGILYKREERAIFGWVFLFFLLVIGIGCFYAYPWVAWPVLAVVVAGVALAFWRLRKIKARASDVPAGASPARDVVPEREEPEWFEAARVIAAAQTGSAALLQRKMSVSFARATELMGELERQGVVGPRDGAAPRRVLVTRDEADVALAVLAGEDPDGR